MCDCSCYYDYCTATTTTASPAATTTTPAAASIAAVTTGTTTGATIAAAATTTAATIAATASGGGSTRKYTHTQTCGSAVYNSLQALEVAIKSYTTHIRTLINPNMYENMHKPLINCV